MSENDEIFEIFDNLLNHPENEIVEFKEAKSNFNTDKLGQYFSAISCEATLKNKQYGWLIFGVNDSTHNVVGTNYKKGPTDYDTEELLENLKYEVSKSTTNGITFIDIKQLSVAEGNLSKRILMFQIPAAAIGIPTYWKNNCFSRAGESLVAMTQDKIDRIRARKRPDWSRELVEGATIEHLDKEAISIARKNYKERMNRPHITEEINNMSDEEFLTKLKLMRDGNVTNAAMVLLGNEDNDDLFERAPHIMWRLYGGRGQDLDYEIFSVPFITVIDKVYGKIRNLKYRYMPNQLTLFSTEIEQYDQSLLKELINNCIAHSDYTIGGRIYVDEFEDKIKITNPGVFLPGKIQVVLNPSYSPPFYKNQLLAEAMMKLFMIDTATLGIRKIFNIQKSRCFPLPDYNFSTFNQVNVIVYGKILNENYTRVLHDNPDFDLYTVFLIDKVQKHEELNKEDIKHLRKLGVIEGKMPNIFVSAKVAVSINEQAQYVKNKGFNDEYYQRLILEYLKKFIKASKDDVRKLLVDKLPEVMNESQKENKVRNILYSMRVNGLIERDGSNTRSSKWQLPNNK